MAAPLAGERVTVAHYPMVRVIKKAATESVTSSTVLQNDDDFTTTLDADKTYLIEAHVAATGATGGDVKIAWAVTGGVAQVTTRECIGPGTGVTDVQGLGAAGPMRTSRHNLTTSVAYGTDNAATSSIVETFLVETTTAGTSGTLTMQWAQNASSATATTVVSSSFVVIREIDLI